jgi:SNF2 family DNA or RNA helicase
MDRNSASKFCRAELDKHSLSNWHVRLTSDPNQPFLGLCVYKDTCIIINAHHVDIHPTNEVINTIRHEVAHALTPGHGHDEVWADKAREIGCDNSLPCSHLNIPEHVLDAIRSGATVEMTVEEKVITNVIRTPKFSVTRLQEKCPDCGKVAVEKFAFETIDKNGDTVKLITLECFHIIKKILPKTTPYETMVSNDWKPEVKNCKHIWIKNQCQSCGEFKLFNFQVVGARAAEIALAMQKGFGFFDDMGLGKTVEALALLRFHAKDYNPTLIVTKSAIKFQWFKQLIRWLGPDFLAQIITTSKDFVMPNLKCYIIPYDLLRRFPREKLEKLNIKLVILDECQQIKNVDSARTQEVRKLVNNNGCKVIPLSGTPWKNRGSEFFPVLNMIDPVKFYSNQHFLDTWVDYYWQGNKKKMGGIRRPEKFREYVNNILIRREYNEVMDEFPDINRTKLNIQLDDLSQNTYDDSVSDFVQWYNDTVSEHDGNEEAISGIEVVAKMSRMRHIVGLAKIPATLGFIEEFIEETDKKIVIFVHHKDVGQLMINALRNTDKASNPDWYQLAQQLIDEDIPVFQYTSAHTGKPEGYQVQEDFNKSKRCIMVASTLACGEGIDLQTCADSILHERQWNPQNEDQATPGRFRRIGQLSNVINITVPQAEGTIEEHLDDTVETKRRQFHVVMNKGEMPRWEEGDIAKEVARKIIAKHQEKKARQGKTGKTNITSMVEMRN